MKGGPPAESFGRDSEKSVEGSGDRDSDTFKLQENSDSDLDF